MNTSRLAAGTVAALVALNTVTGLACSQAYCPYGVYPFSGATSVRADTLVTFYASGEVPRDLPALNGAFTFVNDTNEAQVPFSVEIDPASSSFTLIPDAPLQEGATYRVRGVHAQAYQGGGTWWTANDDQATTVFTVGAGQPSAIDAAYDEEFQEVIVGFSEPVDTDAWTVLVTLPTKPGEDEADAQTARLEPVGSWNGEAHLQRYALNEGNAAEFFAEERRLTISLDEASSEERLHLWLDPFQTPEERLAPLLSLPSCDGW